MQYLKEFSDFKGNINEGIFIDFKSLKKKVSHIYVKILLAFYKMGFKHAWQYYLQFAQDQGLLKQHGIKVYFPSKPTIKGAIISKISNFFSSKKINDSFNEDNFISFSSLINEDHVPMQYVTREGISDNVPNVSPQRLTKEVELILKDPVKIRDNPFIWGSMGIGKSSIIEELAKKHGYSFIKVSLSEKEANDIGGYPEIINIQLNDPDNLLDDDKKTDRRVEKIFPNWIPMIPILKTKSGEYIPFFPLDGGVEKKGFLFFDEFNRASSEVQSTLLEFIRTRKFGNKYMLPEDWIIICAGNREADDTYIEEMVPAASNRFRHFNLVITPKDLEDYSKSGNAEFPLHDDIIKFIYINSRYINDYDPMLKEKAFASSRTWEKASYQYVKRILPMLKDSHGELTDEIREEIQYAILSHIGDRATLAFMEFLEIKQYLQEHDLKEVFHNGGKARLPGEISSHYKVSDNKVFKGDIIVDDTNVENTKLHLKKFAHEINNELENNVNSYGKSGKIDPKTFIITYLYYIVLYSRDMNGTGVVTPEQYRNFIIYLNRFGKEVNTEIGFRFYLLFMEYHDEINKYKGFGASNKKINYSGTIKENPYNQILYMSEEGKEFGRIYTAKYFKSKDLASDKEENIK